MYELKAKMSSQAAKYNAENPDMSKLCSDLAKSVGEKCMAKLTWYHLAGRPKTREWKSWYQKCRGGNRGRNEYGEQKFPFFNIVVESSIGS